MKDQTSIAVIVTSCRESIYVVIAHLAEGGTCRIAAVAGPRELQGRELAAHCQIPPERQFRELRELAQLQRLTDAVIAAIQDRERTEPALAFLRAGYHLLLEKPTAPTAPTAEVSRTIVEVVRKNQRIVAGSHALRSLPHFHKLREFLQAGVIGDLVCFRHFEGGFYRYQAHSHARGNWRTHRESSSMILAKSCHDLDILLFLTGLRDNRFDSFGSLRHFRCANQPAGVAERCLDCPLTQPCVYSAVTYHGRHPANGNHGWPQDNFTEAGLNRVLRKRPYECCVYACDNDVMDHQTVNFLFDNDVS